MSDLTPLRLGLHTRADTCPDCGGPATAFLVVTSTKDQEKPWTRNRCDPCVAKDDAMRRAEREREELERRVVENTAALNVPPLYAMATIDNFVISGVESMKKARVVQLARRYVADWPSVPMILLFLGCPGSGKGHIAWSIARTITSMGQSARVCVLSDTIRDLRESWGSHDDGGLSEAQRLAKYRNADLLVIDEVSRHAFYGQPQQHLYDLVAWREIRMKPTILTTNETGGDLADILGPALSSRALGWSEPWLFGNEDWRAAHGVRRSA